MKQINVNDKVIVLKYSRTTEDTFTVQTVSPPNEFVSVVHYEIKELPFDVFFSNELIKV